MDDRGLPDVTCALGLSLPPKMLEAFYVMLQYTALERTSELQSECIMPTCEDAQRLKLNTVRSSRLAKRECCN